VKSSNAAPGRLFALSQAKDTNRRVRSSQVIIIMPRDRHSKGSKTYVSIEEQLSGLLLDLIVA